MKSMSAAVTWGSNRDLVPPRTPGVRGLPGSGGWAGWAAGLATVAGATLAFLALGWLGVYNLRFIVRYLPTGVGPLVASLELTSFSFGIGFALAMPLGLVRAFGPRLFARRPRTARIALLYPPYALASAYVAIVRGTPFLVQVFVVFYAVIFAYPRFVLLGESVPFWAGLLALTINTTGYQAEALRGGFQSVDASQLDAARALGLGRWKIFRQITLPQSLRLVALPLTNEWISNFKTSAIVSYIAGQELYFWARTDIASHLARPLEAFVMVAVFYLVVNVTLSRVVGYLEQRHRIPGLGYSPLDIEAGVRR